MGFVAPHTKKDVIEKIGQIRAGLEQPEALRGTLGV